MSPASEGKSVPSISRRRGTFLGWRPSKRHHDPREGARTMEHFFGDYPDTGDDIGSFAGGLNSAIDGITAQDDALIAQYAHPADPAADPGGLPAGTVPDTGGLDPGDQTFLSLLGDASHGTLPDGTTAWADNLNNQVNDMQDQTDAAITNAEHSPGFGEVNPNATAA